MPNDYAKKFHQKTLLIDLVCPLASKEEHISDYQKGGVNVIGVLLRQMMTAEELYTS